MAADGLCRDLLVDASFSCIFDVVKAVNEGRALIGVVPLRNSTIGEIPDTQPALHKFPEVAVILSREVPIALSLIGQSGVAFAEIRTVISKAQALEQCRGWLSKNVPGGVCDTGAISAVRLRLIWHGRWLYSIRLRRDVVVCACGTDS
jgi:prephenate dehydratase